MTKIGWSCLIVAAVVCLAVPASAGGGFGLSPYVGVARQTGGGEDSYSLTVGANATYGFNEFFGIGAGYSRIFTPGNDDLPDTNFIGLRGILGLPLGPIRPYAATGPGYYWEIAGPDDESGLFWDAAVGLQIDLAIVHVSSEIAYRALDNGDSYVQPGIWAGIGF